MYLLQICFIIIGIFITSSARCEVTALPFASTDEWEMYKAQFGKYYGGTALSEAYPRYYYTYNTRLISRHNLYYDRNLQTYNLARNQFTDMRLVHFIAHFPKTTTPATSNASPLPVVVAAPDSFNPITDLGLTITVEDQGTLCNSGWAYATAKAIEIMQALQTGNVNPARLSAQNLIDCAGSGTGCKSQVPQTAFDFLAVYGQDLNVESEYKNKKEQAEQGMCIFPQNPAIVTNLGKYSRITDGDDNTMKQHVAAGYPVVIEYDPTSFEFMHYSAGVFQQPKTRGGSHYMVVVGYGHDAKSNLDYWLVLNSFGKTWGENGFIRIVRSAAAPLAKSAYLPIELA